MVYTKQSIIKEDLVQVINDDKESEKSNDMLLNAFKDLRIQFGKDMQLDNVCFLLANGCSICAGSKSIASIKLEKVLGKEIFEEISSIFGPEDEKSMEECLNDLVVALDFYQIMGDKAKEVCIKNAIEKIKNELLSKYVNSVNYDKLFFHNQMLLKLRAFSCLNRVNFFTLNYDLIFEYVMDSLGIKYENGFSGFISRKFDPSSLETDNITKLVKLHGSVNWVFDGSEDGNQIKEIKEIQPKFEKSMIQTTDVENVLIYPTKQKLYQTFNAPYSELMRYMLNKFESRRNVIIVLGYRYSDEHINDILYKAVANPNNVFYFFDHDHNDESEVEKAGGLIKRLLDLSYKLKNINIILGDYLADFRTFVKYMLPANAEQTDQEMLFKLLNSVLKSQAENKHD